MDNSQNSAPQVPQNGGAPGNVYFGSGPGGTAKHMPSRAKLLAIAGIATVLVLGGGGYVLGYYIPNRPVNVYKSALTNTGEGYDQLAEYAQGKDVAKKFQNTEATGNYKLETDGMTTDGTFKAHVDEKNATFSGDLGLGITRMTVDGVVKDVDNSNSPDVFLKVGGIKGMGAQMGMPEMDTLDNQWVTVDHTLIDNFSKQLESSQGLESSNKMTTPTEEDAVEASKIIGDVSKKYLFTNNKDNAVLEMDSFVGKETQDGKPTNHYKVKANKEHLKAYIKELGAELDKTKLNDWAKDSYGKSISQVINVDEMTKQADKIKSGDTFDVWVNTDTKVIHKVRFADKQNADKNFMEFGLNYASGAEKPFFINMASDTDGTTTTGKIGITLNTDTNKIKMAFGVNEVTDGVTTKFTLNMDLKPANDKVNATAPTGSISLSEALQRVGMDGYLDALSQGGLQQELDTTSGSEDPFTVTL
ncbi:MAG TPA: hypothetical protein VLA92_01345 [Candidatus Saccharimonadales bacterium]|nr:hypothetical protein [Candidatus Saccharimonadales bacterium]